MHSARRIGSAAVLSSLMMVWASSAFAKTPNDPFFGDQWYLQKISAPLAWDVTTGNKNIVIAVLDTGIDFKQPDLAQNLWTNKNEIPDNGVDDDKNGYVDDVHGWDFVHDDANPSPDGTGYQDDNIAPSHGTFVAGVIGAETNNNKGYAGVDWQATIMPIRILDEDGTGTENAAAKAIDYARRNGARVINLSFAGDAAGSTFKYAVKRAYEAGVVIVAALGNDGRDVNLEPVYPACLRSDEADWVIGVSATDERDTETEFTNFGSTCADLSAPGVNIPGLRYDGGSGATLTGNQLYLDGTSTASPMVAGAAAIILSQYPTLSPGQVRTALKLSVDPIRETISGRGALGVGRLNVAAALAYAKTLTADTEEEPEEPVEEPPVENPSEGNGDEHFEEQAHYSFVALGANKGAEPYVHVYRADGQEYAGFLAYAPTFRGGVHVATGDFNGDAIPEVVTGAGDGGGPHVRVFNAFGAVIKEFFPYDASSRRGVQVAVGDADGDGVNDIITAVGAGVSNDVVISGEDGKQKSHFTVKGFVPGTPLQVAVGDVDDDWDPEIVVSAMSGEPRVSIYKADGRELVSFLAYGPTMTAGISLSLGDFDGDEREEIVTAPNAGSEHIRIFNKIGALWGQFFAQPQTVGGGARVAVTDIDVDGMKDIVVTPATAEGDIKVFSPKGTLLKTVGNGLVPHIGTELSAW
jgi:hypothetical protein